MYKTTTNRVAWSTTNSSPYSSRGSNRSLVPLVQSPPVGLWALAPSSNSPPDPCCHRQITLSSASISLGLSLTRIPWLDWEPAWIIQDNLRNLRLLTGGPAESPPPSEVGVTNSRRLAWISWYHHWAPHSLPSPSLGTHIHPTSKIHPANSPIITTASPIPILI